MDAHTHTHTQIHTCINLFSQIAENFDEAEELCKLEKDITDVGHALEEAEALKTVSFSVQLCACYTFFIYIHT